MLNWLVCDVWRIAFANEKKFLEEFIEYSGSMDASLTGIYVGKYVVKADVVVCQGQHLTYTIPVNKFLDWCKRV